MILFDISATLEQWNVKITSFLEKNGNNPIFWSIVLIALLALAYWAIRYFDKK